MKNFYKSPLLVPISIGSLKLKNRLVVLPMACVHGMGTDMSEQSIAYYEKKAQGGFGLIIREGDAPYFKESDLESHKELCDRVHAAGSKIIAQCGHPGRQVGNPCVAPSPVPCLMNDIIPHELTTEEIHDIEDAFAEKANFCKRAGYDGVEIHGAHGYLIAEFMSTYANKRSDEYGGTFENRMRFPLEIIHKVREKCGFDYTVSFRISGDEFVPGGRTIEETKAIAIELEKAGVDMINVSGAVYGAEENFMSPMNYPTAYLADFAKEVKSVVNIPVMACNRIRDPKVGESLLLSDKCDLIGMGRASLADPELPNKFFSGRYDEIRPCIGCNQGCLEHLNTWQPVNCMVNPETGNEYLREFKEAKTKKRVAVIGAGPAGMEAAITAARAGHNVTIYEQNPYFGGNFYLASIPPTKGTIAEFTSWQTAELKRRNVEIKLNTKFTPETYEETKPEAVIIATGSVPLIPGIKGIDQSHVVLASDVLTGKVSVGKKIVVCGGGMVGAETATHLAMKNRLDFDNRKVSVIEMKSLIAGDEEYTRRLELLKLMEKLKIDSYTDSTITEILENGVVIDKNGTKETIPCDSVVLAFGYKPETSLFEALKEKVNVQIVGDCNGVANGFKAVREGFLAALNI